ncbi:DNA stabilization protein [Symbiopectobacterium sp. Eva_TO]
MSDELNTPLQGSPGIDPLSIPDALGPVFKLQLITLISHIGMIAQRASSAGQTAFSGQEEIKSIKQRVAVIERDYLSTARDTPQALLSSLGIVTKLLIDNKQVVGPRETGWAAATGTAFIGAFNADQSYAAGATYSQAEIQALAAGLVKAQQRIKALEDMARTHGLID